MWVEMASSMAAALFCPLTNQKQQQHRPPPLPDLFLWPRRSRILTKEQQQPIVCSSTLTSSSSSSSSSLLPSRPRPRPRRKADRNSVPSAASVEEVQAARIERLWYLFLSDPSEWWDKRLDKENPKAPDFKHKTSRKALWINDRFRPPWLQEKLATLTLKCPKYVSSSSPTSKISGQAVTINRLWEEFFSDPSQWWDNRSDKKNPKFPDFKHKTTTKALWIDHRSSPSWVHRRLAAMAKSQEQEESVFSTPDISGRVVKIEQLWQEFFLDPSQWWDNRLMKKSPKYPDFKHKSTNEGLWIESWLNPPWVKPKIITMEVDQTKFDGGSRSRVAYFGGDVSKLCRDGQLKEALQIVEHMVQQSIRAPIKVYACLLQGCTRMKALAEGKRVHALIVQSGFESDMFLGNTLVNMYAKCGNLLDARQVFNKMPEHNVFSWTAIISAYANQGQGEEAINLFKKMQKTGIAPDKVMFVFVLKACASMSALAQGKQLHTQIIESGLELDVFVGSALVDMYAKCGSIEHARQVFNNMQERNVVSWTTMIAGCVQQGLCREALTLFQQMQHEGMKPDKVTFASVLKACASLATLEQGKQVHAQIIKLGFELDTFVGSALVNMYAKCGYIEAACQVFERISKRDLVSWNIMIAGYAQQGLGKKALTLYEQMKQEGVQPDNVTFVSLLKACTSLEQCKRIHAHIARSGVQLNVFVGNTLVDMYSKLESIDDARQVFNKMHELNVITVKNNK